MSADRGGELEAGFRFVTSTLAAARRATDDPATEPAEHVPVTVLTGLLGSGKTTIVEHLLSADHGLRVHVIVNDLGSVNVDGARLAAASASGVERLELTNGCACCALSDDLADTLRRAAGDPVPDAVVVEASGAADPVPMAAVVENEAGLRLDGVVVVADADALPAQLAHPALGHLARRQLAAAHVVLLSKVDLVSSALLDAVRDRLAELAPGRMIVPVCDGAVDPTVLLGAAVRGATIRPPGEPHELTVVSRTIPLPDPVDIGRLAAWLERADHRLLRVKGTVVDDGGARLELQVVGRRWTLTPSNASHEAALVLIADADDALDSAALALDLVI